jgi:Methyltransferase domain
VIQYQFDIALLIYVLEHIENPDSLLQAISLIAPTLIIEVPDFESDALNLVRQTLDSPYYSDADHIREYTLDILHQQLERNGWQIDYSERLKGSILAIARHNSSDFCLIPLNNDQNTASEIIQK